MIRMWTADSIPSPLPHLPRFSSPTVSRHQAFLPEVPSVHVHGSASFLSNAKPACGEIYCMLKEYSLFVCRSMTTSTPTP